MSKVNFMEYTTPKQWGVKTEEERVEQKDIQLWFSVREYMPREFLSPTYIAEYWFCLNRVKDKKVVEKTGNSQSFNHDYLKTALKNQFSKERTGTGDYYTAYYEYEVVS